MALIGAKRVVLVDDSELTRRTLSAALAAAGYEVIALDDLAKLDVSVGLDLLLIDVNMPEVYGDDIVGFLRDRKKIKAPIYLMSSIPEMELATRTRTAGADGYVLKQGGAATVVDRVRAVIGKGS